MGLFAISVCFPYSCRKLLLWYLSGYTQYFPLHDKCLEWEAGRSRSGLHYILEDTWGLESRQVKGSGFRNLHLSASRCGSLCYRSRVYDEKASDWADAHTGEECTDLKFKVLHSQETMFGLDLLFKRHLFDLFNHSDFSGQWSFLYYDFFFLLTTRVCLFQLN